MSVLPSRLLPSRILTNFLLPHRLKIILKKNQTSNQLCTRSYYTVKRKPQEDENYVSNYIYQKIKAKGPVTIAEYMKDVLTNPTHGYYMSKDIFGEDGDFITSPEITQIFGEMIAVWFLNEWRKVGSPKPLQIVELGPGRGTLSADIIKVFSQFNALHKTSLHFVEISPHLSDIQAKTTCTQSQESTFKSSNAYRQGVSPHGIPVSWYKRLKDVPQGFTLLVAHEFFDTLPIHKFHKTYAGYKEVLIDVESTQQNTHKFKYVLARNSTPMLNVLIKPEEERDHVEVSPDCILIYEEMCDRIKMSGGIALICDYGHNGTGTDTFRAFKKHKQVDPLVMPGTADLTADVDFNLIREVANKKDDIIAMGPATQRDFLLKIGIDYRYKSLAENIKDKNDLENLRECYKFLIDENKMGERFKFFCLVPATLRRFLDRYPVVGFS